ncbi:MAG TPA: alpha-hydroxy acid oxidase [Aquabacterium sp.]|uniref:alpha-hydroxy acid oxidase n=1 Tax=Aquabacterium sp. TaxID=1872578 RepID=UPI002E30FFDB|nr:alpha-hydroxy acid oxidase [Aquabacterium sp.]HEX5356218.1 alpha-hydroxy acid oxidase [Aquabacterium sp.]
MSTMQGAECVADYQRAAQARLDERVWAYLQDGDADGEDAAGASVSASVRLMPRPLTRVTGGHTRLSLFGQSLAHPFLTAPVAYQRLFHAHGELASALAASAQGGQQIISSLASHTFADIVQAAGEGGGPGPWFQLYWQQDRAHTLRLLRRAEEAGCTAVVFTVDAPIKLATMSLPADIQAVNLEPTLAGADAPRRDGDSRVFDGWMAQAPDWADLAWLRAQTSLPLLIKGILHPDDAWQAVEAGCDGIVVSSHGGRVLRGAASSWTCLPAVLRRTEGRVPVLLDSGIRSGQDAFAALAMGATAVLVGRPYVWGLAANGAMGVAHVIRLLRDELEMTMALTGCRMLSDIGPDRLA